MATTEEGLAYVTNTSIEQMVRDAIEFSKKIDPKDSNPYATNNLFLLRRGVDTGEFPSKLNNAQRFKVELAISRLSEWSRKEAEQRARTEFEHELQTAYRLVDKVVKSARSNGQKRVTMGYIELYLADSNIELSNRALRILQTKVNLELS
jgi:hypothetical protein